MARQTDAFLVKLWSEPAADGDPPFALRGSVEHLPTHRRRYFTEIVDLVAFLTAHARTVRSDDND